MPLVTDTGFQPVEDEPLVAAAELPESGVGLRIDMPNDFDVETLLPHFNRVDLIVVPFPNFGDGRGFSLARRLRSLGYRGRLRANGHVITDQYAFARFCGFDEVQISGEQAERQPEALWLAAKERPVPPFLKRKALDWT